MIPKLHICGDYTIVFIPFGEVYNLHILKGDKQYTWDYQIAELLGIDLVQYALILINQYNAEFSEGIDNMLVIFKSIEHFEDIVLWIESMLMAKMLTD